jgi:hypothetical protein
VNATGEAQSPFGDTGRSVIEQRLKADLTDMGEVEAASIGLGFPIKVKCKN